MNSERRYMIALAIASAVAVISLHPVAWGVAGVILGYTVGKAA